MESVKQRVVRTVATMGALSVAVGVFAWADPADAGDAGKHLVSTIAHSTTRDRMPVTDVDELIRDAALNHNPYLGQVPANDLTISQLSRTGDDASVTLVPIDRRTDPAQVLLHQVAGTWKVVALGTEEVGCQLTPATRSALRLWGGCPRR